MGIDLGENNNAISNKKNWTTKTHKTKGNQLIIISRQNARGKWQTKQTIC